MEILEEFLELVQIDSDSKAERKMADVLTRKLREIGCDVWEDETAAAVGGSAGNLYAVLPGTRDGALLFSAHMDRVANGRGICPQVHNGQVASRETILAADDLSGVAAILDGLRRVQNSQNPHPRVEVVFSVCEELGVLGSRYLDYSRLYSKIGYVFDSSGHVGKIVNAAPAKTQITLSVTGRAAHAGNEPEKGINAVQAASKVLVHLPDGRVDEETTANFAYFEALGPTNVVAAHALVRGEARSRNDAKLQRYVEQVREACRVVAEETGAAIDIDVIQNYRSFKVSPETPCICLIKRVLSEMGIPADIRSGGGGMDANNFNENGIECVGVASGYFKNHTSRELLYIDDLKLAGELVARLVATFQI